MKKYSILLIVLLLETSFCLLCAQKKDDRFELEFNKIVNKYVKKNNKNPIKWLFLSVTEQKMFFLENMKKIKSYDISTSATSADSNATEGTNKTPLGFLRISKLIGNNAKIGTLFKYQKDTGRIVEVIYNKKKLPKTMEDLITTRVLVLNGLEKGLNAGRNKKGQNVDSQQRGIYIHGTNNEAKIGEPASHGCIRMRNKDIVELFDQVDTNTILYISLN